jgi:hypothetical protein
LLLTLNRATLVAGDRGFPLRPEWIKKEFIANAGQPLPAGHDGATDTRWKRIAEIGKVAVFENTRTLPRAWIATGELVATEEDELSIIRSGKTANGATWNPLEQALVEVNTGIDFGKGNTTACKAGVTRHEPNRLEVKTECAAPSLLVLSENHYPGWRAYLDGQAVKVLRVNYNQRGVALPAGNHLVTFVYRPKSVLIGLVISLLALAALVVWARTKQNPDAGVPGRAARLGWDD